MSKTVDSRIVEMQFDNKDFEKNVDQSLSTLDNLNKQLKNLEGTKGLEELGKSAKNLNFDEAGKSVDGLSCKFSALEEIAIGAFRKIGEQAVLLGEKLVKSLTIDQVMAGFNEYETKMTSVQTMMNSTGEDIDVVKQHLEQLNEYADKTIYSFSDMTSNIGKFTNAGVDLTTATEAIKGISNWAALAGANANEAGRAMYNISQSMSGGYMQLIDWKSVKFANMATQTVLKNLAETAEVMGTVQKNADGTYTTLTRNMKGKAGENLTLQQLFNEGLNFQWLTTDVLMETMDHFSKDYGKTQEEIAKMTEEERKLYEAEKKTYEEALLQKGYTQEQVDAIIKLGSDANKAATQVKTFSMLMDTLKEAVGSGWAMTFEYIFGDLEQAKVLWTAVSDEIGGIIGRVADWRNGILKEWGAAGGRDALIEGLANLWRAVKEFVKPIGEAFSEVFTGDPTANLLELSFRFRDFAKNLQVSSKMAEGIKGTFKGLFSILKALGRGIKTIWTLSQPLLKLAGKIIEVIVSIVGAIGKVISGLVGAGDAISGIGSSAEGTLTIFDKIAARFEALAEPLKTFKENLASIFDAHWLGRENGLLNVFNTLFESIKAVVALIIDSVSALTGIDLSKFEGNVIGAMNHVRDEVRLRFMEIGDFFSNIFSKIHIDGSIFGNIKTFFTDPEFRGEAIEAGKNMVLGLAQGIRDAVGQFIPQTLRDLFHTIVDGVKSLFGIHSPSTVFIAIGQFLIEGFSLGIKYGISDYIKPVVHEIVDTLTNLFNSGDLGTKFKEVGSNIVAGIGVGIQNGWNYLPKAIVSIVDNIINTFKQLLGIHSPSTVMAVVIGAMIVAGIGVGIREALPLLGPAFDGLKQWFANVEPWFGWIGEAFKYFGESLVSVFKLIKTVVAGIVDTFSKLDLATKFANYFKNMDAETMIKELRKLLAFIAVLFTVISLLRTLSNLTNLAEKGIGAVTKVGELAGSFGELADALRKEVKTRMIRALIRDLAITLTAIVASIYVLGKMDPETLKKGAIVVAAIGAVLAGIVITIFALSRSSAMAVQALMAMNEFGKVFLYIGGSFLMIAAAIRMIGKINFSEMNQAKSVLVGIGVFVLLYQGLMIMLSSVFGNAAVNAVWKVLLGAAGSVYILALAIKKIADVPEEGFTRALFTIAFLEAIAGAIAAVVVGVSKMPKGKVASSLAGLGIAMIGVGICVNLIASATRHMAYLAQNSDYWVAGLAAIVGIMAMLGILMAVASKMNRAWKSLLSLSALFIAMALVIKVVADMEPTQIAKGVVTIVLLEALVAGLIAFTGLINKKLGSDKTANVMKTLIGAAAAIGIMGYVVAMLSTLPPEAQIWRAVGVVAALGAVMAGLIAVTGWANGAGGTLTNTSSGSFKGLRKGGNFSRTTQRGNGAGVGQIIAIALSLVILSHAVIKLSAIPLDGLMQASSVIILIGLVMAGLMWLMGYIGRLEGFKISTVISIGVMIALVTGALVLLTQFDDQWRGMLAGALGLALVFVALGAMFKLIGEVPTLEKGQIVSIIAVLLTVGILAGILFAVSLLSKDMDWAVIAAFGIGLSAMLLSLGAALKLADGVNWQAAVTLAIGSISLLAAAAALTIVGHFLTGEDWPAIIAGAIGMGLAIVALAFALNIANGISPMAAVTLLIASLALVPAGIGLAVLAQFDWGSILAAAVAISAVIVVMSICLTMLSALSVEGLVGALLLVAIAGALALAGFGLAQVAQYDWQSILAAMLAMIVVIGVATAAVAILGGLGMAVVGVVGVAMLLGIAAALWILGEAMKAAAEAIQIFANVVMTFFTPQTALNMLAFWTTLADGIPEAVMRMVAGIMAGISAFTVAIPLIKQALKNLILAISAALEELITVIEAEGVKIAIAVGKCIYNIKEAFKAGLSGKDFEGFGENITQGLANGINKGAKGSNSPVSAILNVAGGVISGFCKKLLINSPSLLFKLFGTFVTTGLVSGLVSGEGSVFDAGSLLGGAAEDGFLSGASGLLNGDIAKQLGEQLGIDLGDNFSLSGLKDLDLSNLDLSKFNFEGIDDLDVSNFLNQLKECGVEADGIDETLANIQNKDNTIEFTGKLDTTEIEKETKKVMDGTYGHGVDRWKKMYEDYLKAYNGDVAKALDAVSQIQNEVNKKLGSSVTHNMDEMGKKLGISAEEIKKAKEAASSGTMESKAKRDFKTDPYEGKKASGEDISKADAEAKKQLMNNTSHADYQAKVEGKITAERKAQTDEAYKQLEANTHITTEAEKQTAESKLKANQQMMANGALTDEKRKQLDAENKTYQAVIDTYNQQTKMRDAINEGTEAQKKQTEAVKETQKAASQAIMPKKGAVVYGSDEYYKQTGKSSGTINNQAAKAAATQVKSEPVKTKEPVTTKTDVKVEVDKVDTTQIETKVVKAVEDTSKKIKSAVNIKPKVDASEAGRSIDDLKRKTQDLSKSIPDTFKGVSTEVSKSMKAISDTMKKEGATFETTCKDVFKKAANSASTAMTSNEIINKFVTAGKNMANGLIRGINAKKTDVTKAAKSLGNAAANGTKSALKEHSPSKVMAQVGAYAGDGLINGMLGTLRSVFSAGNQMGDAAVEGLAQNIDSIQYALDAVDLDYSPSIVPVIDTSQIQAGVQSINNVMAQNRVAGITADMNLSAQYNQSQIDILKEQMANVQGAINGLGDILTNQPTPEVNANVILQGDADGVFKLVQQTNNRYTKMHGKSAFA